MKETPPREGAIPCPAHSSQMGDAPFDVPRAACIHFIFMVLSAKCKATYILPKVRTFFGALVQQGRGGWKEHSKVVVVATRTSLRCPPCMTIVHALAAVDISQGEWKDPLVSAVLGLALHAEPQRDTHGCVTQRAP